MIYSGLGCVKGCVTTVQVLIFIRGLNKSNEVYEELPDFISIHGTTTGKDIFELKT